LVEVAKVEMESVGGMTVQFYEARNAGSGRLRQKISWRAGIVPGISAS